jgi:hypothetical protein
MASKSLMESVDEQFSIQQKLRKTRKRVLSGKESDLFNEAKKVRKTSSELIADVERLEAAENKAQNVENVWKKRMSILEILQYRAIILLRLNDEAYEHGDTDEESYRSTIVEMLKLRKICLEGQLFLATKQLDIKSFKEELVWVPKEHHQQMATLLLSSFIEKEHREHTKGALGLKVKNRLGNTVTWRSYLASEYQGSYRHQDSVEAVILDEVKIEKEDRLWEPILGDWVVASRVTAAHIVARSERDIYIRFLFGVEDYASFLMDARNGLLMLSALEAAFDRGEFIIVPMGFDESDHIKLQCRVLRYANLHTKGGKKTMVYRESEYHPVIYWDDIHERVLKFPKECKLRPYRRCLFHHAIGGVMHCRQLRLKGWEEIWNNFFSGSIWATPGKYLEKSLLQGTWDLLIGEQIPLGLERFSFLGLGGFTKVDSQMWASELMGKIVEEGEEEEEEEDDEEEEGSEA